jgi:hypothetical protein
MLIVWNVWRSLKWVHFLVLNTIHWINPCPLGGMSLNKIMCACTWVCLVVTWCSQPCVVWENVEIVINDTQHMFISLQAPLVLTHPLWCQLVGAWLCIHGACSIIRQVHLFHPHTYSKHTTCVDMYQGIVCADHMTHPWCIISHTWLQSIQPQTLLTVLQNTVLHAPSCSGGPSSYNSSSMHACHACRPCTMSIHGWWCSPCHTCKPRP